jgi:hypothetical protein
VVISNLEPCNVPWTPLSVMLLEGMLKKFVIRIEFDVVYPTSLEFCDNRALKISATVLSL